MHAEYVDIPYSWDRDFLDDSKIHILVIGDSMARDWCNILNESEYSDEYEISYVYSTNLNDSYSSRLKNADYIFFTTIGYSRYIPDLLKEYIMKDNFYVVGIKNFGDSNGQIYQKRFRYDYFESRVKVSYNIYINMSFLEQNKAQKDFFTSHYIDLIEPIIDENNTVPVFSGNNKFISADTEHLTQDGAIFYSKILDLSFIRK